jgi:CBS domain-containing protein
MTSVAQGHLVPDAPLPGPADPARSIMAFPVVSVDAGATLREAAEALICDEVGAAVVTSQGPVGLLSERDIIRVVAGGGDVNAVHVSEVMSIPLVYVGPDDPIQDAAAVMLEADIRHLPVGDGHRLVGMLSVREVLGALAVGG